MRFKDYELDPFQEQAIHSLEKGHSVVVSAATGTGKTLIADYIIDKAIRNNQRVFYTAPIKALSNQKFKDFKRDYGAEKIGILTGDIQINQRAQIIVMTTEIYRNMLLAKDPEPEQVSYVIFDEIHYISDLERGTIWEESLIFSPSHVRFVCLSATIPNAREFAQWISHIKRHTVDVIQYDKRAVPLRHLVYEKKLGLVEPHELKKDMEVEARSMLALPKHKRLMRMKGGKDGRGKGKGQDSRYEDKGATHIDVVRTLRNKSLLPCIFFVFSRNFCEQKADELARQFDFATKEEKAEIIRESAQYVSGEIRLLQSTRFLKGLITRGIAVHHAGMLPKLKELVEHLFGLGLIKVLYATETFAVGINMPAKTVCFNSLTKFDGMSFRYLNSKEYFQLAGRAGRRGIDTEGYAISLVNRENLEIDKIIHMSTKDVEPIISRFQLSINTALNLVHNHTNTETAIILKSNFDYYVKKAKHVDIRITASFNNKLKQLLKMGCIAPVPEGAVMLNQDRTYYLTEKGLFARHIYSNELLLTEIFGTPLHLQFTPMEMSMVLAAIVYEPRRADKFDIRGNQDIENRIMHKLGRDPFVFKAFPRQNLRKLLNTVGNWIENEDFEQVLSMSNLQEGDIIRLFRQVLDLERQLIKASQDFSLQERIRACMNLVDKGVVKVDF